MSKFGKYVTPTYEKDFLMYGVLSYETKVKSMRHIMDYIYYYSATDDEETSISDVPGLTMWELSNGHMVVEAMKRNPVLKQIILRFLTAREKPDHHVVQAIRWLSDTVTADAMDLTDEQRYQAAWEACVENPGPIFTDEGIDEDYNGTETSAETTTEPEDANGLSGTMSPKIEQHKVQPKKKISTRKKRGGKTTAKSKPHPLAKDAGSPPAGIAIEEWQRVYNNADSQQYKLHGKNSALSRGDRKSGVTREKAMYFIRNGHW